METTDALRSENEALRQRVEALEATNALMGRLGTTLEYESFLDQLGYAALQTVGCERAIILVMDEQGAVLEYAAALPPEASDLREQANELRLSAKADSPESLVGQWTAGHTVHFGGQGGADASLTWLAAKISSMSYAAAPIRTSGQLVGVLIADHVRSGIPVSVEQAQALEVVAYHAATPLRNAMTHYRMLQELAVSMREMHIMRQIDRELSDTIDLDHVFEMTLDWALRFSAAQAVSLALYDQDSNQLYFLMEYGYDLSREQMQLIRQESGSGVTERVARSGRVEVVPDVSADPGFVRLLASTRSQLAVPVMREDRVVAVITLESRKVNGFSDVHVDFVKKLAARAGVAIDNARLYEESVREREKLSHILNHTADVVMVIGLDECLLLINQSALSALQLDPGVDYSHQAIDIALAGTPVLDLFERARRREELWTEELTAPSGRIFHANLRRFEGIGWILVMHDITPYKEMDKLKSELIATVSHDLKQPLSVMNGYIELMLMQEAVSSHGMNAITMIRRAMQSMRQLIDDLLDLAKIEAGVKLDLQAISLEQSIRECLEHLRGMAEAKAISLEYEAPAETPPVLADRARLRQILVNLVSNAIKYTPGEGWVRVSVERRLDSVRIAVQDNGMGISPEDQIHIFDRFYRVRRPETDNIEGTGLGLAIVKSLVEAHQGQIALESRLAEGSTFYVTLPAAF